MLCVCKKSAACNKLRTLLNCRFALQALQINGMQLGDGAVRVTRSRTAMKPVKQEFLPRSVSCSWAVSMLGHACSPIAHLTFGLDPPISCTLGCAKPTLMVQYEERERCGRTVYVANVDDHLEAADIRRFFSKFCGECMPAVCTDQ
jgi:hypothetical protein